MGVGELIKVLGSTVIRDTTLDQLGLSGKKVGIDATIWLVAVKNSLIKNEPRFNLLSKEDQKKTHAERFMKYCEERFKVLEDLNIKLMMVFDGNATPRKTEIKLLKKKIKEGSSMSREEAVNVDPDDLDPDESESDSDVDCDGDNVRDNERKEVNFIKPETKYIPDMDTVLKWLKKQGVEFIIAPYEADAQLTYLAVNNKIDAVITEDTDLIPFGCPHVIFKLNVEKLSCKQYKFDNLKYHEKYGRFTEKMLLETCIIIGCDYLPNLQGVGKKKAPDAIQTHKNYTNFILDYKQDLKLRIGVEEGNEFERSKPKILEEFQKAIKAFTYQQVYDPDSRTCTRLSHIEYNNLREDNYEILGPFLTDEAAHAIATGTETSEIRKDYILKTVSCQGTKRQFGSKVFIEQFFEPVDRKPRKRNISGKS